MLQATGACSTSLRSERSRFIASTGQSGNPLSAHYRDLAELWAKGETIAMTTEAGAYAQDAIGRLTLAPAAPR